LSSTRQARITFHGSQVLTALSQERLRVPFDSCHVTLVQNCVCELEWVDVYFYFIEVVRWVHVDVGGSSSDLLEDFLDVDAVFRYA
jgi:hypothetical protein